MLDTAFDRPPGDVGNAASWHCPTRFRRVGGASPDRVIRAGAEGLIPDFIAVGRELVAEGCSALLTSCGFMARHQARLSQALGVPVAASSLMQLPMVARTLGEGAVAGVLTYDQDSLSADSFHAVGADPAVPVMGLPRDGAFHRLIEGGARYDHAGMAREMLTATEALLAKDPSIRALVFECTNMPPFANLVSRTFGLPVYDILTLGHWLYTATSPRPFAGCQEVR